MFASAKAGAFDSLHSKEAVQWYKRLQDALKTEERKEWEPVNDGRKRDGWNITEEEMGNFTYIYRRILAVEHSYLGIESSSEEASSFSSLCLSFRSTDG